MKNKTLKMCLIQEKKEVENLKLVAWETAEGGSGGQGGPQISDETFDEIFMFLNLCYLLL